MEGCRPNGMQLEWDMLPKCSYSWYIPASGQHGIDCLDTVGGFYVKTLYPIVRFNSMHEGYGNRHWLRKERAMAQENMTTLHVNGRYSGQAVGKRGNRAGGTDGKYAVEMIDRACHRSLVSKGE